MKKVVVIMIVVILGFGTQSFSQIQDIVCTDDSTLVIDNVYAGILNSIDINTDKFSYTDTYDFRVGAMATWHVKKWVDINTQAMYDRRDSTDLFVNQFSIRLHTESWEVEFGKMATTATEIRPLPMTADGQFETWTESQMPGKAIGAKIGYKSNFGSIKAGVSSRNGNPEYSFHLNTSIKNNVFNLVGVIGGEKESNYLVGFTHKITKVDNATKLYQVAVFKQQFNAGTLLNEQIAGYFCSYEVSEKMKLNLYLDAGYNLTSEESPRLEGGLIKNFESKIFKGLIAIGYANETKNIKAYLFIHI